MFADSVFDAQSENSCGRFFGAMQVMLGLVVFLTMIVIKALAAPSALHISFIFIPFYYAVFFACLQTLLLGRIACDYDWDSGCIGPCKCSSGSFGDYFILPNLLFVAPALYVGILVHCRLVYGAGRTCVRGRARACVPSRSQPPHAARCTLRAARSTLLLHLPTWTCTLSFSPAARWLCRAAARKGARSCAALKLPF